MMEDKELLGPSQSSSRRFQVVSYLGLSVHFTMFPITVWKYHTVILGQRSLPPLPLFQCLRIHVRAVFYVTVLGC